MTKKLIPFSRELYEKGYRAVRRDGLEILGIFFDEPYKDEFPVTQIYRRENGFVNVTGNNSNGRNFENEDCENSSDLFLEAKTIDLYIHIDNVEYSNCEILTDKGYASKSVMILTCSKAVSENIFGECATGKVIKVTVDEKTLEQV